MTTTRTQAAADAATVTLHQTAPWNPSLTNPYRTRYAHRSGRYFRAEADSLNGFWYLEEITAEGKVIPGGPSDHGFLALCRNLAAVRAAITQYLAGATRSQVWKAAREAPAVGTGRNHPRNVENRSLWRR